MRVMLAGTTHWVVTAVLDEVEGAGAVNLGVLPKSRAHPLAAYAGAAVATAMVGNAHAAP